LAVTLVAKNIPFKLNGLDNLSIKETDRIKALIIEFEKIGIHIQSEANYSISWSGNEEIHMSKDHILETYEDHRMALAFAPLCIITKQLKINNPEVVSKSYPNYWENLKEAGFNIQ
jgi:3-phosphoshikimate 1-carboxyvinyltransferase